MKVLYNWLKDFVPLEISAAETAQALARLGFEIAEGQSFGGKLQGVVTALVKECVKHPNADRLSLCTVWDGHKDFSVVCGAPNVRVGQKVAFAPVGAILPDGETLRATKIRGVESQGMICSAEELGLTDKSEWIVRRLLRCGYRPINNIVDIPNYVMHELGQPLHAFDAARLQGRQLRVRRAKPGETLLTLEGKTAVLEEGMLVIADESKPAALAGIM